MSGSILYGGAEALHVRRREIAEGVFSFASGLLGPIDFAAWTGRLQGVGLPTTPEGLALASPFDHVVRQVTTILFATLPAVTAVELESMHLRVDTTLGVAGNTTAENVDIAGMVTAGALQTVELALSGSIAVTGALDITGALGPAVDPSTGEVDALDMGRIGAAAIPAAGELSIEGNLTAGGISFHGQESPAILQDSRTGTSIYAAPGDRPAANTQAGFKQILGGPTADTGWFTLRSHVTGDITANPPTEFTLPFANPLPVSAIAGPGEIGQPCDVQLWARDMVGGTSFAQAQPLNASSGIQFVFDNVGRIRVVTGELSTAIANLITKQSVQLRACLWMRGSL